MKATITTLTSLIITAGQALASNAAPEGEGLGLLAMLFIGFGVLIIMFQFIPGILLMVGMLKGLFSLGHKEAQDSSK